MADEINALLERVAIHRKNLNFLLKQAALFGTALPFHHANHVNHEQAQLATLKQQLASLGHTLADLPDDTGGVEQFLRTTEEEALALFTTMPTDDIPEPCYNFAPGSRWYNRARNPDFVGREPELRQLATTLKAGSTSISGPTAVATSMGGIGKTDLATEFMYRYGCFFAGGVFWLSFADPDQIDAEIAACGGPDALELFSARDKLELADQIKKVLKVWSQPVPRLIICDNCEDQALLHTYRKKIGAACRMLVTSRDHTWNQPSFTRIALNTLKRTESIHLLQHLCSRLRDDEADTIAEQLGDFPLALHLAGSYLTTYDHHTIDGYLEKLRELDILNHPSMQGRGAGFSPTEHDLHVARTFALSFDRLDEHNPIDALAIHLLACAAQLAPGEPIPRDFLLAMVSEDIDQDDAVDSMNRIRAIGFLDGHDTLIMHHLVHQYVQDVLHTHHAATQQRVWQVMIDQIRAADTQGSGRSILELEPHLRSTALHAYQIKTAQSSSLLDRIARFFALQGRYREAEPLYARALTIREQSLGLDHPDTATSLNNLALLYSHQGRLMEAEPLYTQALSIHEETLGPDHPDTATSVGNLASLYESQGRYGDAEPLYARALTIREQSLGLDHPDTATSLNNLAGLYYQQEEYGEAELLYTRALTIREQTLGPDHPSTAQVISNLASLYYQQKEYGEAELLYTRALTIREQTLGSDHPQTAGTLNNLASLYSHQGRLMEAEPLYARALTIREQTLGLDHPDTATSLNNLAGLYYQQEEYGEAELLYTRALTIREQSLGPDHPGTAQVISNLADLYYQLGRYGDAEPLYARVLTIREQSLGPDHPDTVRSLNNLADLYYQLEHYGDAELLYARVLAIQEQTLGVDHPDTVRSLNNLADLYYQLGRYRNAEPLYTRALTIREQTLGVDHPDTARILNNLALLYELQGHLDH